MTPAFIIAISMHQADLTARIDWGWQRAGRGKWQRPDGLVVTYAGRPDALCGTRGAIVFLGHEWWRCDEMFRVAEDMKRAGRLKIARGPDCPVPGRPA